MLVDGEHHPAAVADALREIGRDEEIAAVAFCGGDEKVPAHVLDDPVRYYGHELVRAETPAEVLAAALDRTGADLVFDLSDEPRVPPSVKAKLAAVAAGHGAAFALVESTSSRPLPSVPLPAVAVVGTGKRSGKTAVCGQMARLLVARGRSPAIVSMGRGGPPEPALAAPPIGLEELIGLARSGVHAASDYLEDAALAGVPTVGCRRVGTRADGTPAFTNFAQGAALASQIQGVDALLFEGSGACLPPVDADASVCVVGTADQLAEPTGRARVASADLVLVPAASREVCRSARELAQATVVEFALEPRAAAPVRAGAKVASFTTGGPPPAGAPIAFHSDALARRTELATDLDAALAKGCDLILTEIKAAGIDTVAVAAAERGVEVGFISNVPVSAGADGGADLDGFLFNVWR